MELKMSDSQRQDELTAKYKDLQGWGGDEINRIAEKEKDGENISGKLLQSIRNLQENTSLLALPNEELLNLLLKLSEFVLEVDTEANRRL